VTFNIPEEDAVSAIPEFARQAGLQIIASVQALKGLKTHAVSGQMDVHEALRRLDCWHRAHHFF